MSRSENRGSARGRSRIRNRFQIPTHLLCRNETPRLPLADLSLWSWSDRIAWLADAFDLVDQACDRLFTFRAWLYEEATLDGRASAPDVVEAVRVPDEDAAPTAEPRPRRGHRH